MLDSDSPVYFSSVSIVEIAIASAWGLPAELDFVPQLNGLGYQKLPLIAVDAKELSRFPAPNGHDPFGRILIAQAATHWLRFETVEKKLLALALPGVNDATSDSPVHNHARCGTRPLGKRRTRETKISVEQSGESPTSQSVGA